MLYRAASDLSTLSDRPPLTASLYHTVPGLLSGYSKVTDRLITREFSPSRLSGCTARIGFEVD